jgi:hypothetical protein
VLPWAELGFAGLRAYPHLLADVSRGEGPQSYSLAALFHGVVPSWTAATTVDTVVGAGLLLLMLEAGRRRRDRDAFALAIVAALVLTPLLEMHYLAALLVVIALYRPRFSVVWLVPLLIWGAPATVAGSTFQVVHVLAVAAAAVILAMNHRRPQVLERVLRFETA